MTIDEIKGYPRLVFMLTDGAVNNVTQVVKFIKAHTQYARINSIGIGDGCSKDLIENSAKKGKGYSIFIDDE
jgi:von Willebrand factor A domain-containing protein 5